MNSGTIKLNNSTEVIPIQGTSDKRPDSLKIRNKGVVPTATVPRPSPNANPRPNPNSKSRNERKRMPYFSDPMIVPRVKQYLEAHSNDNRIDFEDMVDSLQSNFKDYAKRKRSAFKGLVDRAYYVVLQECTATRNVSKDKGDVNLSTESSAEEDYDSDEMMDDDSFMENGNKANIQLMSMYANAQARKSVQPDMSQELINISSSDEEIEGAKKTKINEPSSTVKTAVISSLPAAQIFPVPNGRKHMSPLVPPSTPRPTTTVTSVDRSRKRKAAEVYADTKPPPISDKRKKEITTQASRVTFKDFGGNAKVLEEICKLLVHIRHPEVYRRIGVSPPRGFLLHGPPGCGKTLLAQAIAGELEIPLMKVAAPELVAGVSGQSEQMIRNLFDQALAAAPCILFLDEVDAITPNRQTAQREMERRIVAQLLTCLDDMNEKENGDQVMVIGATNRPDALDPALRRAGRFDREICLGIPNLEARVQILEVVCKNLRLAPDINFNTIARNTPGFVGADLKALTREAAMAAINRAFGDLKRKEEKERKDCEVAKIQSVKSYVEKSEDAAVSSEKQVEVKEGPGDSSCKVGGAAEDEIKNNMQTDENKHEEAKEPQEKMESHSEKNDAEEKPESTTTDKINEEEKMEVCESTEPAEQNEEVSEETDAPAKQNEEVPEETDAPAKQNEEETDTPQEKSHSERKCGPVLEELISWLHDQVPLTSSQLTDLYVGEGDFEQALKCVQPSAKREGFATVPDVTWDDIGSLQDIREELKMAILAPVRHPAQCKSLGLSTPSGVLLCGPPGCGKTLLAKAVANEAGVNFISVKGPELLNMYLGESERAVRQCFQRARNSAPCVIFFDELDALCPKRAESGEGASNRVVNQMLTEMDGMEGRKDVYIMAATNRPDIIDSAVLRPGRLDKILYVGLPSAKDRVDILNALTKKGTRPSLASDVSLKQLGESSQCDGYTGADLSALVREASLEALREALVNDDNSEQLIVANKHFKRALEKIRPSVTEKNRKHYEKLQEIYAAVPSRATSTNV